MFEIRRFSCVTSTNDIAKELAKKGEREGITVLADAQTKGRGRMGRAFFSPCGTGLYMSILLRPKMQADKALLITTAAAAAVARAIEKHTGKAALIKWVNDIFLDGKKVCGILTEGSVRSDGSLEYAILGIGVNLDVPKGGFGELENIAGAVFGGKPFDRDAFVGDILSNFEEYYLSLEKKPHYGNYIKRDMLVGKTVDVIRAGERLYTAKAVGIDEDFALLVEQDGNTHRLDCGEVSVKI